MFPIIHHINDLLPFIDGNPQFRVAPQPNGTTVVCYMLQDEDTFTGENEEWSKECRGITFHADGTVAARTLHKFQNIGENEQTQPDNIPWDRIVRVMDKRDGSMITPVLVNGDVLCKTKKTFTSNEALAATEFLYQDTMRVEWVRALLQNGITPTFEWTSPRFPIVLTYDKDELTLLHMRDNVSGEYFSEDRMKFLMPMANPKLFPIVENMIGLFSAAQVTDDGVQNRVDWDVFKHAAETRTGTEGWIVQADDGQMWKIKTAWYIKLHRSVTFTRWRDVARTVAEDQSDDLKAAFAMTGRSIEPILKVERKIKARIEQQRGVVEVLVRGGLAEDLDAKAMAIKYKDLDCFGLIMTMFRGKDIDWMAWYLKHHINEWPLDVIPTAVQNEDVAEEA